jgi:hypothetical protein
MKKEFTKSITIRTNKSNEPLFDSIASLIQESRIRVAVAVNSELALLYWQIGNLIRKGVLKDKRADYAKQTVRKLSYQLTESFGNGWGENI